MVRTRAAVLWAPFFPSLSFIMAVSLVWELLSIKACFCHYISKAVGFGVGRVTSREPGCSCSRDLLQGVLMDEKPSECRREVLLGPQCGPVSLQLAD